MAAQDPQIDALMKAVVGNDANSSGKAPSGRKDSSFINPEIQALYDALNVPDSGKASIPMKPNYDPSAGGSTLQIAPLAMLGSDRSFDTGIRTPQWLDRGLAGAGQGLTDIVRHAGDLVGLTSDQELADAKERDAPLLDTTAGKVGNFLGTTAALLPLGLGAGAGLAKLGTLGARLAANPLAYGAFQGASQGALAADPGQRLQGAAVGGVLGTALPMLGGGISTLAKGLARTPEAQALLDKGVDLSLGQMNPSGVGSRIEQALVGTPIGGKIQNLRNNAMGQYSRSMLEDALPPGAKLTTSSTDFNDLVDQAADHFSSAYDATHGIKVSPTIVRMTGTSEPLADALDQVVTKPRLGLTASDRASWGTQLKDQLDEMVNNASNKGGMKSQDLLGFRSAIRDAIRGEAGDTNASRATIGLLKDAEGQVTQSLESQLPPKIAQALRATDQQYGKFAIIRNAAKAAKDKPGGPSPFQISSAIAQATNPNSYARGAGFNRDLSKAAMATFQDNAPKTGLTGQGTLGLLGALGGVLGAPALLAHPVMSGIGAAGLGAGAGLAFTQTGRRLAAGNTAAQRALQGGLLNMQAAIPASMRRLPGLYGTSGLLGAIAPRLQNMQPVPDNR